jgi:hypothetical protein
MVCARPQAVDVLADSDFLVEPVDARFAHSASGSAKSFPFTIVVTGKPKPWGNAREYHHCDA